MATSTITRDYLVRYQQTAIRETGRRPLTWLRTPMDDALLLPGCMRPGFSFWQPVPWKNDKAPLGKAAELFHQSIIDYVSMCQFLEIRIQLPVAHTGSPLSFLYGRTFETCPNTELSPPSRAFEEAAIYSRENPGMPLAYCMAVTCDDGEPLALMLRAEDGGAFIVRAMGQNAVLDLKLGVERLLPKLKFIYDL